MRVEIGKYYRLKPRDYSSIIGKCTGFTKVYPFIPIFEFEYKDFGEWKKGSNAFDYWAIEELSEDAYKQHIRENRLDELGI
jgi:hypothetical protein